MTPNLNILVQILINIKDFEAIQKTCSLVFSGLKSQGEYTPACFLNSTYSTTHTLSHTLYYNY